MIDTGCYGWKFVTLGDGRWAMVHCQRPGFVKRYIRKLKRAEKIRRHRRDRHEARREISLDY